jgi:long-subunit acyl-CoA synthetase (AMP-forming)
MQSSVASRAATVCGAFRATARACAKHPALRSSDGAVDWTWGDYDARVSEAAAGLAGLGVKRGDTVACWMSNRPEFHVSDMAAMHLGAASFSVYPTYTVEQAERVIRDSDARVMITEARTIDRALAVRARGRSRLESIVVVDDGLPATVLSWAELLDCAPDAFDLEEVSATVRPSDLATLIYTSGTTGAPKGVQVTHANIMALLSSLSQRLGLPDRISAISWLPMAQVAERICTHYLPIAHGWSVTTCDDARAIAQVVADTHPEFFFSPPRMWERLRAQVLAQTAGEIPTQSGARRIVETVGLDRIRAAIVGATQCPKEVIQFWHALGVPLAEVYCLSEATGVVALNPPEEVKVGTVGPPLDGVEVKLSDLGEILIRGPVVMTGYRNHPEQTADAIDADGWLHSGDAGALDDDGYLRIVDRIKELIINQAGRNMSPANIEAALKTSGDLIGQVCVIGDRRPYNTALITLDADGAAAFAKAHGIEIYSPIAIAALPELEAEIAAEVDRANERLARAEQIRRFTILPVDWAPDGDELTPTMGLKRRPIARKYAAEIELMYA